MITQLRNVEVDIDDGSAHSIQELTTKAGFMLHSGPDIERDTVVHVYSACNDFQMRLVNSNSHVAFAVGEQVSYVPFT